MAPSPADSWRRPRRRQVANRRLAPPYPCARIPAQPLKEHLEGRIGLFQLRFKLRSGVIVDRIAPQPAPRTEGRQRAGMRSAGARERGKAKRAGRLGAWVARRALELRERRVALEPLRQSCSTLVANLVVEKSVSRRRGARGGCEWARGGRAGRGGVRGEARTRAT
eukprot:scaffold88114_cov32-Tisochrysis_lutea.AAC.1